MYIWKNFEDYISLIDLVTWCIVGLFGLLRKNRNKVFGWNRRALRHCSFGVISNKAKYSVNQVLLVFSGCSLDMKSASWCPATFGTPFKPHKSVRARTRAVKRLSNYSKFALFRPVR